MIFLYPFIYVYYFISYLVVLPLYCIKYFSLGLYYLIKIIVKGIINLLSYLIDGILYILKHFFYGLKSVFNYIFKFIGIIIKQFINVIKLFFTGLYIIVKNIFNYIFMIVKSFMSGLYLIFKSIYKIIFKIVKSFATGLYLIGKMIFNFIFKIIKSFATGLYLVGKYIYIFISFIIRLFINGIKVIFNNLFIYIWMAFKKFTMAIWHAISTIINAIATAIKKTISGISYVINNFGSIVRKNINNFTNYIKGKVNNVKKYFIDKYNGFAWVKYLKNKNDFQRKVLLIDFMDEENIERSEKKLTYQYIARNPEGKIVTGYFDAFSKVDVHSFLLAEGDEVYSIKTSKYIQFLASLRHNKHYTINYKHLAFLLTQLSTYIKAGISLVDALKILSRQEKNTTRKSIYDAVIYEVVMGAGLSEAMEKQGPAFPKLLINMIKTSEMTGKISEVLDNMAEYYDSAQKTRSQMLSAMLYPSMVFIMATAVIVFVMLFIIPQFVEMFKNMDAPIPGITRFVINTSDFLQKNILYVAIGVVVFIFIFRFLYTTVKAFRYITQWIMMHFPVMGNIIIYNEVTMFAKTFGSLLTHNVFITDSMEILSKITNNEIYKLLIFDTISNLGRGEEISAAFKNHWAFPRIAYEMLQTGEKTGEVGVMMNKVGDYYQEQHKLAIGQIKNFIEPVMIIFLAGTVGTILLSIIVPMFSMYQQF